MRDRDKLRDRGMKETVEGTILKRGRMKRGVMKEERR